MQTSTALWNHVREHDLCPGVQSLEEWQDVRWIRARIRGRLIPIFPVIGYCEKLHLHDVHHVLTGYSTRLSGEFELAAWELASGGCAWHVPFWIDRMLAVVLGLIFCPRRTWRAARRGRGCHNLYGRRAADVLATEFEELRRSVGL
jgi:hypothetical protein